MATKSAQPEAERAEVIEELLDGVDTALDRVKVLYEQYFLGIQKQPPSYLHTDVERKLRDLAQAQIRNTAQRYRFATLQQKFGSYHGYWRRTLRQIENGTYVRSLSKIGRQAARTGAAVPEEILAAMPRRMREQVVRDREAALALARVRDRQDAERELLAQTDDIDFAGEDTDEIEAAFIHEPSELRRNVLTERGAHRVDEADSEFDVDAFFASVIRSDTAPPPFREARAARPDSRPPAASHRESGMRPPSLSPTATAHPRPASLSGSPDAAIVAGAPRPGGSSSAGPGAVASSTGTAPGALAASGEARAPGAPPPAAVPNRPPGAHVAQVLPRLSVSAPPAAPSQSTMPLRIVPGSLAERAPVAVETLSGPFPRMPSPPSGAEMSGPRVSGAIPPIDPGVPRISGAIPSIDPGGPRVSGPMPVNPRATGTAPAVEPAGTRRGMASAEPGSPLASGALPAVESSGARSPLTAEPAPARVSPAAPGGSQVNPAVPIAGSVVPSVSPSAGGRTNPSASDETPGAATSAPGSRAARALRTPPAGQPTARATPPGGQPSVRMSQPVPPPIPGQRAPTPAAGEPSVRMSQPVPAAGEPSVRMSQPVPAAGQRAPTPPAGEPSVRMSQPVPAAGQRVPTPPAGEPSVRMSQPVPAAGQRVPTPPAGEPSVRMSQPVPPVAGRSAPEPLPSDAATPSAAASPRRAATPRPGSVERPDARPKLPPGMTDADVNALYAKYVQAKQILGEEAEPGTYGKLLKTINAQAPKIMDQYKARAVDFSVVVKDNQVIIRAKPKP